MKNILYALILLGLSNCKPTLKNELQNYNVIYIVVFDTVFVNTDSKLASDIKDKLNSARRVKNIYKGKGIGIVLSSHSDTIQMLTYPSSNILNFNNKFYKTDNIILPDSISDWLLRIYDK